MIVGHKSQILEIVWILPLTCKLWNGPQHSLESIVLWKAIRKHLSLVTSAPLVNQVAWSNQLVGQLTMMLNWHLRFRPRSEISAPSLNSPAKKWHHSVNLYLPRLLWKKVSWARLRLRAQAEQQYCCQHKSINKAVWLLIWRIEKEKSIRLEITTWIVAKGHEKPIPATLQATCQA